MLQENGEVSYNMDCVPVWTAWQYGPFCSCTTKHLQTDSTYYETFLLVDNELIPTSQYMMEHGLIAGLCIDEKTNLNQFSFYAVSQVFWVQMQAKVITQIVKTICFRNSHKNMQLFFKVMHNKIATITSILLIIIKPRNWKFYLLAENINTKLQSFINGKAISAVGLLFKLYWFCVSYSHLILK